MNSRNVIRLDRTVAESHVGIVRLVAIRPEFQGKGIGAAMMLAVESVASDAGIDHLRTSTASDAVGFYVRLGWAITDANRRNPVMAKSILP
jgi:GNAT superfamily N-acetyltransferase